MVVIFVWFGIQKFTPYAADAIAPLIQHSPFMSWLGVFGVRGEAKIVGSIELTTAALLVIGSTVPVASALARVLTSLSTNAWLTCVMWRAHIYCHAHNTHISRQRLDRGA